jgi:apolipoprotein N-acyltransferase
MNRVRRLIALLVAVVCGAGALSFAIRGMWPQAGIALFALLLLWVIERVNSRDQAK